MRYQSRSLNQDPFLSTLLGACGECDGIGTRLVVDEELVIPDDSISIAEGAIAPWSLGTSSEYFERLLEGLGKELTFSMDAPWKN